MISAVRIQWHLHFLFFASSTFSCDECQFEYYWLDSVVLVAYECNWNRKPEEWRLLNPKVQTKHILSHLCVIKYWKCWAQRHYMPVPNFKHGNIRPPRHYRPAKTIEVKGLCKKEGQTLRRLKHEIQVEPNLFQGAQLRTSAHNYVVF